MSGTTVGSAARRAVGADAREPAVEEEREAERGRKAERHRDRGEDERVRDGDPEDVVVEELPEVVEPDEARRPDEVVLGEREAERDERREQHEGGEPEEVRREHQRQLASFAHRSTRSPVTASKRCTSSRRNAESHLVSLPRPALGRDARDETPGEVDEGVAARNLDEVDARRHVAVEPQVLGSDAELGALGHRDERACRLGVEEVHPGRAEKRGHEPVGRPPVDLVGRSRPASRGLPP